MKTSSKGINLIKKYEGCRLTSYKCPAGVWTIGVGHTGDVKPNMTITQAHAEELLKKDLEKFEKGVLNIIKVPLNQNQFDALVSFSFNVGLANLRASTLAKYINAKKFNLASNEFPKWVYANKVKLNGLVKRRTEEKQLFIS